MRIFYETKSCRPSSSLLIIFKDSLKEGSLEMFDDLVTDLAGLIVRTFVKRAGANRFSDLPFITRIELPGCISAGLNSALPLDYPYIVVAMFVEEQRFCSVVGFPRKKIPGAHDILCPETSVYVPVENIAEFRNLRLDGAVRSFCAFNGAEEMLKRMKLQ
ncbi:MAG: hypothetical protein A3J67_02095 [Parcubacteria group bacterium RIFCSPHIGHO2_02_FULL_48_10b]|nr:MAG: hypothetical protein A3J67_02095 [Parcubacteria group bacterium RIFCSPHIGHO2_02_FULL_48_10b]